MNDSCHNCEGRYYGCHGGCPLYTQPGDAEKARMERMTEKLVVDGYFFDKNIRMRKISKGSRY